MKTIVIGGGVLGLGLLLWWWNGSTVEITNYPPPTPTVVAFGDSLVAGVGATEGNSFVAGVSRGLGKPVVNLGNPGDTTADGLERIPQALAYEPGVVILLLGGNDYLRQLEPAVTEANLARLISTFQEQDAVVVLLGVRGGIFTDGYDDMFERLHKEYGTVYVSNVLAGLLGRPELMADTIHPNDAGYAIIAERVLAAWEEAGL